MSKNCEVDIRQQRRPVCDFSRNHLKRKSRFKSSRAHHFSLRNQAILKMFAQSLHNIARPADRRGKFPVTIRHRASAAKIYAPGGKFAYYRVAYTTAGKRKMQTFAVYSDAKAAAERIVREAASGSQVAALSASQSRDALAALQRLEAFRQSTGKRLSLLAAVSEHVGLLEKSNGRSPGEAVEGYLGQSDLMAVKSK